MTEGRRVASVLGETLARLHDGPVFGLAGSGNFELLASFLDAGGRYVGTRHEAGAILMADGWAQLSRGPGVASVHQGPGFTNALTAIIDAIKGRTPLLVLAADTARSDRSSHQFVDQAAMLEAAAIGAEVVTVDDPALALGQLADAYARARRERQCIVLLLPVDVLNTVAGSDPAFASADELAAVAPTKADLERIVDAVRAARTPVILAGRGAVLAEAGPGLAALADALAAPLITTAPARGLFTGHPLSAGIAGGFGSRLTTDLLQGADLVLAFGTSLDHWTLVGGAVIGAETRVLRVDSGAAPRDGVLEICADARLTAEALAVREGVGRPAAERSEVAERIAAERAAAERTGDRAHGIRVPDDQQPDGRGALDPRTLLARLDEILPASRTVVIDSGHFMAFAAVSLDVARGGDLLFGQAFQSVGLGLGRATGAAIARPDAVTVAVVGDGGFMMGSADLDTAVRAGVALVVVVVNDEGFGAEVHDFEPLGIDAAIARYPGTDAAAVARGAGARAHVIRSPADLDAIADDLRAPAGTIVLDCRVDPSVDAVSILTEEGRAEWSSPLH